MGGSVGSSKGVDTVRSSRVQTGQVPAGLDV